MPEMAKPSLPDCKRHQRRITREMEVIARTSISLNRLVERVGQGESRVLLAVDEEGWWRVTVSEYGRVAIVVEDLYADLDLLFVRGLKVGRTWRFRVPPDTARIFAVWAAPTPRAVRLDRLVEAAQDLAFTVIQALQVPERWICARSLNVAVDESP